MAETVPANTTRLGENAYMIRSAQAEMADCFVFAHGGNVDKALTFIVPPKVTIRFIVNAGEANNSHGGPVAYIESEMAAYERGVRIENSRGRRIFAPGMPCPDYILYKALGTHYDVVANRATYRDVRAMLDRERAPGNGLNWVPHVVTVRNRTSLIRNKNIWLSTLVRDILAAHPGITSIYCANCRINVSPPTAAALLKAVGARSLTR